jgi:hypothetical protein
MMEWVLKYLNYIRFFFLTTAEAPSLQERGVLRNCERYYLKPVRVAVETFRNRDANLLRRGTKFFKFLFRNLEK